jgi:hypothetical protein
MERKFKIPPVLQITPPMIFQRDRTRFPSISAMCATNKLERSIATLVVVRNTMLRLVYTTDFEIMLKWLSSIKVSEQVHDVGQEDAVVLQARHRLHRNTHVLSDQVLNACGPHYLHS